MNKKIIILLVSLALPFRLFNIPEPEPSSMVVKSTKKFFPTVLDTTNEEDFMSALHYMTHQKVTATTKWGSLEITDERINELVKVLDEKEFEHEIYYRETLKDWKAGDFSNSVDVHNRIWNAQGGTLGRALGLMTADEEAVYKKENF